MSKTANISQIIIETLEVSGYTLTFLEEFVLATDPEGNEWEFALPVRHEVGEDEEEG